VIAEEFEIHPSTKEKTNQRVNLGVCKDGNQIGKSRLNDFMIIIEFGVIVLLLLFYLCV
jgi:hypothetical protein